MNITNQKDQTYEANPLVNWSSVTAGSVVGGGVATAAGLVWVAAAFSSHEAWAYAHMAPWIGASVAAGALIGGAVTGVLSKARGSIAGAAGGLTTGAVITAAAGVIAILTLAVNGSFDQSLVWTGHAATVEFLRPYVAFWAAAGALVLASAGGILGGLVPRSPAHAQVIELATITDLSTTAASRDEFGQAVGL